MYDRLPGARAQDAAQDPDPLRRRRRARPQQRARRGRLPAQHRPRRHARSEARRGDRAHHGRGGAGHRHPVGVRALRDRGARRALGPHVRGLLRGSRRWSRSWARRRCAGSRARTSRTRCACWPAPSTTSATAARPAEPGSPTSEGPAGARRSTRATRALDEATLRRIHLPGYVGGDRGRASASIMPSYSSWNGEKCSGSKRLLTEILKDELGFEGLPDLRLQRHRPAARRLPSRGQAVDQRRHGHGDGPGASTRSSTTTLKDLVGEGRGADVAHRRRGARASCASKFAHGPDGHEALAAGRPQPARSASARPSTARWRGAPCASRSCC